MRNVILGLFVIVGVFFVSCKDEDEDCKNSFIGKWQVDGFLLNSAVEFDTTKVTDYFNSIYFPACEKDNIINILTGNLAIQDAGALKCKPTDPQTIQSTWDIKDDCNLFELITFGSAFQAKIIELSPTRFRYQAKIDFGSNGISNGTVSLKRIE